MRVEPRGANRTVIHMTDGRKVYVSYRTPVAIVYPDRTAAQTSKKWSVTTSKHVGMFLREERATAIREEPQEFFDALLEGA